MYILRLNNTKEKNTPDEAFKVNLATYYLSLSAELIYFHVGV